MERLTCWETHILRDSHILRDLRDSHIERLTYWSVSCHIAVFVYCMSYTYWETHIPWETHISVTDTFLCLYVLYHTHVCVPYIPVSVYLISHTYQCLCLYILRDSNIWAMHTSESDTILCLYILYHTHICVRFIAVSGSQNIQTLHREFFCKG